jgi:hypothetical protein
MPCTGFWHPTRRIAAEIAGLGRKVSPATVWAIVKKSGFDPAPRRGDLTWSQFLKAQASGILACDFFSVDEYQAHFNTHRPHRALNQADPLRALSDPIDADTKVIRRDRLGGLLHEYTQVAWGDTVFGTHRLANNSMGMRGQAR